MVVTGAKCAYQAFLLVVVRLVVCLLVCLCVAAVAVDVVTR